MLLFDSFPNYIDEISKKYCTIRLDKNTHEKQRKVSLLIMLIISLPISFGLGMNMYYYHGNSVKAILNFSIFFILAFFYVIPLHYLILCLFYPVKLNSNKCFVGIDINYFIPFCYCKREISKYRIISSIVIQFFILTVIPYSLMLLFKANLCLYAIGSCNALITSFQLYDLYILITKTNNIKSVLKSNNSYYYVYKRNEEI